MKRGIIAAASTCLALVVMGARMIAAPAGDATKGKTVFDDNCAVCHNADSTEKKMGPGLKGLYKKDKLANGKKPTDANVKAVINAGGNGMPGFADSLSDAERDDVLAYLKTL